MTVKTWALVALTIALLLGKIGHAQDVTIYESTGPDQERAVEPQTEDNSRSHTELVPNFDGEEVPKLKEKLKNGTYVYDTKPSVQKNGASVHIGSYTLNNLQGDTPQISYQSIYNTSKALLVSADFEHQFFKSFGKLGIKPGIGFFTAKGYGHFVHTPSLASDAQFTLYAFPISVGPVYHLQFWDRQILVPYGEAGGDYFGILEYRDDKTSINDSLKFGGAAAWHWAAGLQFQLDFLDRHGLWNLDASYGINHIYLSADIKQVYGLSSTFDFSGTIYEGGIFVEF